MTRTLFGRHWRFLDAVAGLIAETIEAAGSLDRARPARGATYVWDRNLYDLTCTSRQPADRGAASVACPGCLETEFHVRNRTTGNKSGFRLTYPTEGELSGIPVRIVYRPRWWFEAELTLKEAR